MARTVRGADPREGETACRAWLDWAPTVRSTPAWPLLISRRMTSE
jgi:hypothetical protein